ncbi:MAG: hypothetical protein KAH56_05525 [Candidatus Krumholzibacteria bacterium]|nr:hypothetical protein [Candidatus Krumholzibacteria bacterium]
MEFRIEYKDGYFVGTTFGEAVTAQFEDLLGAMLVHAEWNPGMSWMYDHTELLADPLTADDIRTIAQMCSDRRELLGMGRCAIVAGRDLEFGLGRMLSMYVDGRWDVDVSVFRTVAEGLEWLLHIKTNGVCCEFPD